MLRTAFLVVLLAGLLIAPPVRATVLTGEGSAAVSQTLADGSQLQRMSTVLAAYAHNVGGSPFQAALRLQFIRPDQKAVAYAVWRLPPVGDGGTFHLAGGEAEILYYEQRPNGESKLFVGDQAEGYVAIQGPMSLATLDPLAQFAFTVRSFGEDGLADTADDEVRTITSGDVVFFARGDLSGVSYYYDEYDTVHSGGEMVIVYGDGCTGSPDGYDDDYGYDTGDTDDSYRGDSCDGDVYDDDYDDDSWDTDSDWNSGTGDDYSDSSCDYEDDYDDSNSDWDYDSSDSDWSWDDDDESDWDWEGDEYELRHLTLRTMSWAASGLSWLRHHARRPLARLAPLLLVILALLGLKRVTRKRLGVDYSA